MTLAPEDRATPVDADSTTPPPLEQASASCSALTETANTAKSQSESSPQNSTTATTSANAKKRNSTASDLPAPPKITKRRAARACVSCRARKVRCDVVEGAPCGNCRWDNVECIVQESRRRKKTLQQLTANGAAARHVSAVEAHPRGLTRSTTPIAITSADTRRPSTEPSISPSIEGNGGTNGLFGNDGLSGMDGHVPHLLYQRSGYHNQALLDKLRATDTNPQQLLNNFLNQAGLPGDVRDSPLFSAINDLDTSAQAQLPPNIRPLPAKIAPEDVRYLRAKGALSLPSVALQHALVQAYVEYVHPYMPLLDLHEFLSTVNTTDGSRGRLSLFLYQAVMFAAAAFVDIRHLREAGYPTRKNARKSFYQKTRLLYDFDYESDRLILVQALLLKTFWYESPDDQKDTWHWMGVAISLAHTIGLHRDPAATNMSIRKQKLWKRIWWSCFMRDRLIALGMRRPTRIKDEDFDVPMLDRNDFDIECLPTENTVIPAECTLMRDLAMQEELAEMCIAKAKLCVCISHMLKAQYSVLARDKMEPDATTNSTMMLLPNKDQDNADMVKTVDLELMGWETDLHECCRYRSLTPLDIKDGKSTIAVHRILLHMVYHTTVSALHRPQFLPSSSAQGLTGPRMAQDMARLRVRDAASRITMMATELHHYRLERYLPTTGVTVILPAMIIHLLEMKNPLPQARDRATHGFRQCMKVMEKLRETYAAADYATGFLEAALRKAAIDLNPPTASPEQMTLPAINTPGKYTQQSFHAQTPPPDNFMTVSDTTMFATAYSSFMSPQAMGPGLDLTTASPPQTEKDLESVMGSLTPSQSGSCGSSDEMNIDMDMMQDPGQFNWNTDVDVDQWLQFPPEGVSNSDDTFMAGAFGDEPGASAMSAEQALVWASASLAGDQTQNPAALQV